MDYLAFAAPKQVVNPEAASFCSVVSKEPQSPGLPQPPELGAPLAPLPPPQGSWFLICLQADVESLQASTDPANFLNICWALGAARSNAQLWPSY